MTTAFHNDPAAKAAFLEVFDAATVDVDGNMGSLTSRLTQGGDSARLADLTGYPESLLLLMERLAASLTQVWFADEAETARNRAIASIRQWFADVTPGAGLADVPAAVIKWLIEDALDRTRSEGGDAALDEQWHALSGLLERHTAGEDVSRKEWSTVRKGTLAMNDTLSEGPTRWTGMAIEAAAWNPSTSSVVLSDMLRSTNQIRNQAAVVATGWTTADAQRSQQILDGILAETKDRRDAGEQIQIPPLFTAADPVLQARFADQINAGSRASFAFYQEILDVCAGLVATATSSGNTPPPIIPRTLLFGNPARTGNQISPDGRWLSWHAPVGGVMNVWIAPRETPGEGRPLTCDVGRGIKGHMWAFDNRHILYTQDKNGNENAQVYALDVETRTVRALTDDPQALFMLAQVSKHHPGQVLIASNERDRRFHDLVLFDIATGERRLIEKNDGFAFYVTDTDFNPVLASKSYPDGSRVLSRRASGADWTDWISFEVEDANTSGPAGLSADGATLYLSDSRGREASALLAIDIATDDVRLIAEDSRGPVGVVLIDIDSFEPLAWGINIERKEVHVLDDRIAGDVARFEGMGWADWGVMSRTLDDRFWIVGTSSDINPGAAYLYDRKTGSLDKLADGRPELANAPLSRMYPFTITSRDGLPLVGYLTIPIEADASIGAGPRAKRALPMVLEVHGGPAMRDGFGFNAQHQWLANRGYAVLSVNFRGSSGFSKSFLAAGDGEWGARMSDDLDDAVVWAVSQGIADPDRVAISGASYGGYAVLAGLTRTPKAFACGIDLVGPSNLETLMAAIPPYWESHRASLYRKVGDPGTAAGMALLRERSPLHRADRIVRPLLIGQGANDPRVLKQEADQMADAMAANGVPVTYLLYPDEGHGFGRPANAVSFSGISEAFLARYLGGRSEPLSDDEVAGAKVEVVVSDAWLRDVLPVGLSAVIKPAVA